MDSSKKLLAKRAKRDAKRKVLKHQNAIKKTAMNKSRRLVADRHEAMIKLRDDIFDFIVQKDSFKKFLRNMIKGSKELKATNDPKYDGIIISAYEKGLAKIDELIEPTLTELAKVVDDIDPNKEISTTISEYLNASRLFSDISVKFNEILDAVNRYHNHNVSIYKNVDDPEKIVEFSEDDFDFGDSSDADIPELAELDAIDDVPNSHEDVEANVVVDDQPVETTEAAETVEEVIETVQPEETQTPEPEK